MPLQQRTAGIFGGQRAFHRRILLLFHQFPELPEGELTKLRASLVCEKALHVFAQEIHLGDYLLLGKGEEHTGGRMRSSILADAFEAVIAAIYLDGGMEAAERHIMRFPGL